MSIHCQVKIALSVDGNGIRPTHVRAGILYKRAEPDRSNGVKGLHQRPHRESWDPWSANQACFEWHDLADCRQVRKNSRKELDKYMPTGI
jgi:hypothetical protein